MEELDAIPVVWIVGESVFIEGVATSLKGQIYLSLVRWEKLNAAFLQQVRIMKPTMVIFELDVPGSGKLLELLKDCPGLQMVGIDRDFVQVIVLSSYCRQPRTMFELYNIVMDLAGKAAELQKGGDQLGESTISSGLKSL